MSFETDRAIYVNYVEERTEVIRKHAARHGVGRARIRLGGVAEPSQVGCKQLEAISKSRDDRLPHVAELRPTMQQDQRRPVPLAHIMNVDAVRASEE
jgi:hypothetical protein